jgi:hypothetical protein
MLAARLVIVTITPDEVLTQTRERARLLTGTIGGGGAIGRQPGRGLARGGCIAVALSMANAYG